MPLPVAGRAVLRNLEGTNSIAYTSADPVVLAKTLTKAVKEVPAFKFKRRRGGRPGDFR